jgi:MFS family permease
VPRRDDSPIRRDLRLSCVDGSTFSVMVGAGELYLPAFAMALGVDKVTAGLVATVPLLVGSGLQLVSPWAAERLKSNGRWCVLTAGIQAVTFVPLIAFALTGHASAAALFAVASVYFGAGFASGPSWTTWIEALVPRRIASHYFARRSAWCFGAEITAIAAAGLALEAGDSAGRQLLAFAAILAVAGAARLVSMRCLAAQRDPVPRPAGERHLSMGEIATGEGHRAVRRLFAFLLVSYVAMQISVPFVTPYLRGVLRLPNTRYAALLAIPYAARVLSLPFLGGVARRLGARRVMWTGALALVPAAGLWAVSTDFMWLAFVQAVTGFAMAAFELANLLLWFETIRPEERTSILTTYQFWYATAVAAGSVLGSVVLVRFGEGHAAFVVLFLVSAAARLAAAGLFARVGRVAPSR